MFIQFTVSNFLSIKEAVTLNMTAVSTIKEFGDNIITTDKANLLKSAAIYGANASGKSKLLMALNFFESFVINSSRETQVNDKINVSPFRLNPSYLNSPSSFEISFINEDVKYRYGFELDEKKIHTEWLFATAKVKEVPLFIRQEQKFEIHKEFKEGKGIGDKTRTNALFISVVAQFNGELATSILQWFKRFNIISGMEDESYEGFTASLFKERKKKSKKNK